MSKRSIVRELLESGELLEAAKLEAAACDRDGYGGTAELIRRLAAQLSSATEAAQRPTPKEGVG